MSLAVAAPSPAAVLAHDPIRVMVVDDAVVVRGMVARWIEAEPDMQIVASLRGGREAIEQVERRNPDVVILDVTMPDIDGITALPRLLEKKRDLVVLMASTLTRRNAEISLRALQLGAADYIPKPESSREFSTSLSFRRELIDKIRALGSRRKRGPIGARIIAPSAFIAPARGEQRASEIELEAPILDARSLDARSSPVFGPAAEPGRILLRPFPPTTPRVLLIGSSTGGPQALNALLGVIGQVIDTAPVLITQHIAADLHGHSGRASHARERAPRRRGGGRRARPPRAHLHCARRPAHAGGAARRRARDRTRRWAGHQFLQAGR